MEKNNIEFSSIRITKALREAIKGAAELGERSEEDFIHQTLAFMVGRIIRNKFEVVNLRGESVDEDFELLKHRYAMQKEGKRVLLRTEGDSDNFEIYHKAMSKMVEWLKDKEDIETSVYDPFELFWKNIKHEEEWKKLEWGKLLELQEALVHESSVFLVFIG